MRTDGDGLDLDALLDVSGGRVVRLLMAENGFAAEGVDEGGPAWRGNRHQHGWLCRNAGTCDSPVPEAPQTIRQNWMPFLTFFFRRIIFCAVNMLALGVELDWRD